MSDIVDLSMNEGEPPPRECFDVLERIGPGILRKYAKPAPLEEAYAAHLGTDPAHVLATTAATTPSTGSFAHSWRPTRRWSFRPPPSR